MFSRSVVLSRRAQRMVSCISLHVPVLRQVYLQHSQARQRVYTIRQMTPLTSIMDHGSQSRWEGVAACLILKCLRQVELIHGRCLVGGLPHMCRLYYKVLVPVLEVGAKAEPT